MFIILAESRKIVVARTYFEHHNFNLLAAFVPQHLQSHIHNIGNKSDIKITTSSVVS